MSEQSMGVFRINEDRLAGYWAAYGPVGLMQQIGAPPEPAEPG